MVGVLRSGMSLAQILKGSHNCYKSMSEDPGLKKTWEGCSF